MIIAKGVIQPVDYLLIAGFSNLIKAISINTLFFYDFFNFITFLIGFILALFGNA